MSEHQTSIIQGQATDMGPEASEQKGSDVPVMGDQPAIGEGIGLPPAHDAADKTEERREEMEQTRAELGETMDVSQERPSPEHPGEQAKETAQGKAKLPIGQARELIRGAMGGKVEQIVPGTGDTAKKVVGSAGDTAKKVAGSAGDMAKTVMLPARIIPFAAGLITGLTAGLSLGLLINSTARSGATARVELPAPPDVAPRPWWLVWRGM